jgi:hypothetical protein
LDNINTSGYILESLLDDIYNIVDELKTSIEETDIIIDQFDTCNKKKEIIIRAIKLKIGNKKNQ